MNERSWPFWTAAAALAAVVIGLLAWARPPLPGTGFERLQFEGPTCTGASEASVVREPFIRATDRGDGRCVRWSAQMVAWTRMRARVEMTSEPGGSVAIDGRTVAFDEAAHPARTRSGTIELARGVHSFVVEHRGESAPAYLRVALADELAPHNFEFAPPLDGDAFFTSTQDASRALQSRNISPADAESPSSDRPALPAYAACLAFSCAATFVWLAIRRRRARAVPWLDLGIAALLFTAALVVRARGVAEEDNTWDELVYVDTAAHWIRNLALGDFHAEAWRFSLTHPPNMKWALALGVALDGHTGARIVAASESALAVALLFAFGRVAFGRAVGAVAAALAVFLPLWVAYGRVAGHESHVILWWTASMVALACWLRSLGEDGAIASREGTPLESGDPVSAFACVFAATIGLWSKAIMVWLFPLLGAILLVRSRHALRRGLLILPLAAVAGGLAATILTFAAWPYLWMRPYDQATQLAYLIGPGKPTGPIEVYLGKLTTPAWHYFAYGFGAETPALLLVAAVAGGVIAFAARGSRSSALVCLMWLVFPFAQSLSAIRISAGRYVAQAWPALLLFAAIALVALGELAANLAFARRTWARRVLRASPGILAIAYTWAALFHIEPYPLDYYNELVGGASGVAAKRTFEVPWWGEGNLAAVRALDETAPQGARVFLALWPKHVIARLRDDLVTVSDRASADYVLVSHLQYFEQPPSGCTLESSVQAAGAPLVDTYHCFRTSPASLGFAAMGRNAIDEAVGDFRAALQRDPRDPEGLFGMGWAAQMKGDFKQAEVLYVQAASRAAETSDAETEYFARFDLGTTYAQESKNDQAVDSFRAALAVVDRAPDRFATRAWSVWLNLGRALAATGREADARTALERASSLRPGEPAIADALSLLARRRDAGTESR